MSKNSLFNSLNLTTIPLDEQACVFENKFILSDNLNKPGNTGDMTVNPSINSFLTAPYPFKIQFSMLHLCLAGSMRVKLNLNEYELHRNTMMIVTPGSIGQCLEISSDCRIAFIAFSNDYLITEENSEGALTIRKFLSDSPLLQLSDSQANEMFSIYRAMHAKLQQTDFRFKREILKGYLQILYCEICQLMIPYVELQDSRQSSRKKQIFDRFIEELRQHYALERSIGFYADKLCLTPKYLSQVIYSVSGRHAGEWIRDYVILEAKALLKSQQYSVQQVSDMLNFANQSFFGAYFKRCVGCSPIAYKEM